MKLTRRQIQTLVNKGVLKQELDGSLTEVKAVPKAAPRPVPDNKKRSWKVHDFERDWDGFITAVHITEK